MATASPEVLQLPQSAYMHQPQPSPTKPRSLRLPPQLAERMDPQRISKALGWFSIGLGLAELLAPRALGKAIGVGNGARERWLLRACGLREILNGVGVLSERQPAGWMWARVGGDAIDLALLSAALRSEDSDTARLTLAAAAVAGVSALDVFCSRQLSSTAQARGGILRVSKTIGIERSPEELYRFWRNFENLPRFMTHLKEVRVLDDKRSHWVASGPAKLPVEWDAEIVNDRPNEWIAWRSVEGADVENAGLVRFEHARNGNGTILRIDMRYNPPAGTVGATFAKLLGQAPDQQLQRELRRFKQLMETNEIPTTDGQPSGQRSLFGRLVSPNR